MAQQPTLVWDDAPRSTPTKPVTLKFDDEFKPASSTVPSKPPVAPAPTKRLGKTRTVSWLGEKNLPVVGEFRHPHSAQALDVIKYPTPTQQDPQSHILLVSAGPNGNPYVVEPDGKGGYKRKGSFRPAGPAYDPAADMASLAAMQANDDSQLAAVRGVQGKAAAAPRAAPAPAQSPSQAPAAPSVQHLASQIETLKKWKKDRPGEVEELERDFTKFYKFSDNNEPDIAAIYAQSAEAKFAKLLHELGAPDRFVSQREQVQMGMVEPPQVVRNDGAGGQVSAIGSLAGSETQGFQSSAAGMGEQFAQRDAHEQRVAEQSANVSGNAAWRAAESFGNAAEGFGTGALRLIPGTPEAFDKWLDERSRKQGAFADANARAAGEGVGGNIERIGQGIAASYGAVAPGAAIGALTGGTATGMALSAGLSTYGSAMQEAHDAGLRGESAQRYGTGMALMEIAPSLLATKVLKIPGLEGAFVKSGVQPKTFLAAINHAAKKIVSTGLQEIPDETATLAGQDILAILENIDPNRIIMSGERLGNVIAQSFLGAAAANAAGGGHIKNVWKSAWNSADIRSNGKKYVEPASGPADWAKAHPEKADEIVAAVEAGKPISRSMMEANSLPTMDSVKRAEWAAKVQSAVVDLKAKGVVDEAAVEIAAQEKSAADAKAAEEAAKKPLKSMKKKPVAASTEEMRQALDESSKAFNEQYADQIAEINAEDAKTPASLIEDLAKSTTQDEFVARAPKASGEGIPVTFEKLLSYTKHEPTGEYSGPEGGVQREVSAPAKFKADGLAVVRVEDRYIGRFKDDSGKLVTYRDSEGNAVGILSITFGDDGKPASLEVAVEPSWRGRGIASLLYGRAEQIFPGVENATGLGGYTEDGARFAHSRLSKKIKADAAARPDTARAKGETANADLFIERNLDREYGDTSESELDKMEVDYIRDTGESARDWNGEGDRLPYTNEFKQWLERKLTGSPTDAAQSNLPQQPTQQQPAPPAQSQAEVPPTQQAEAREPTSAPQGGVGERTIQLDDEDFVTPMGGSLSRNTVAEQARQPSAAFKTSQGSEYQLHEDGTTTRNKSLHAGHDKNDTGKKRRSDATFFVSPDGAREVGMWQTSSATGKRIAIEGDTAILLSNNPKTGRPGIDGRIKLSKAPAVGMHPLEVWDKNDKGWYRSNHPGSAITEINNVAQPDLAELTSPEQPAPPAQPQAEVPPTQQAEAREPAPASQSGVGERTIQLDDMEMNDLRRKGFSSDQIAMMDDATLKRNGVVRINKYNPPPLKGLKGGFKNTANNPAKTASPVLTQGQQIRVISRAYPGTEIKPVAGEPGRYTVTLPNGKFLTVLYTPEVVEGPANRERLRQSLEARKAAAGNNTPVTEAELDNATITGFWRVSDGKGFETDGQGLVRILDSLGEGQATATALHEARHSLVSMGLMTEAEFDALAMEAARKSGQKPKTIADAEEMIAALAEKGDLGARGFIQTIRDIINRFMAAITGDRWKPNAQTATKRIQSGKVLRRAGKTESRREAAGRLSAEVGSDVRYSAGMSNPLQVESIDLSKFGWREQDDDYIYHVTSKPNADKIAKSGFSRGKSMFTAGSYPAYSKGKTFFTDRSGVKYWEDRVEQQLFHSHDDPPDVAVVRIPKSLVADMLQDDKTGTDDAKHNAYYIDTNELTAAQKKAAGGGAVDAEVAGDIRYSADIPDSIAFKPDHELTTAQFIRRELPFVKQRIPWNESQWEKANKRMGEAFGEMAQGIYGKKWGEFVADTVAANDSVEDWSVGLSDMLADAPNLELMRTILPRAFDAAGVDMPKGTFDEAGGYGVPDDYVEMAGEDIISVAGELVKELESRIPRMKAGPWKDSASHLLDEMLKISDPVEYLIRQHNDDVRRAIESGAKVPAEVRKEYENRNAEVGGDVRYAAATDPSQAKKERAAPPHYSQLPDTAATKESYQQVADLANPGFIQAVRDEIDRMRISNAEEVVKVAATLPGIRKQAAEIANSDQKAVEEMLLKGRPMTAVENEAARIVVNNKIQEALATGDKKLFDQAQELQYKYTNEARSEMGLALMIGRDVLETPYERNRRLVHETIVGIPASIADAIDAAFKYARELQQGGDEIGARKRLREAEKMKSDAIKAAKENYEFLKKIGLLPKDQDGWNELYSNTRKTSRAIREALARQATLYSKVMEYWSSAGILSGPVTHARNLAGTPANYALFKLPTRMLTDVASVLIGKKPAGMAVGEWNAARKAFWPGLWKGFAHGWDSLVQEVGTFDELHRNTYRGLLEGADGKYSIAGVKGRIARMVGWGPLRAADQFWKAFIGTMEANRAAYEIARAHNPNASPEALELHMLELVTNVRSAAWKKAMAVADEATFTEDGSVARKGAKNLVKAMRRNPIGKAIGLPFFIPFVDTPVNMAAQAMSYTPGVGLLSMVFKAMDNVATGKKKSDSQIEMLMRQVVGGAYYMILSGLKGLFDEDEKDEMDTVIYGGDHPTHPYAMRYNGKYYNYLGIEPIGTALAIMADFHNRVMKSDKPWDDKSSQAFISMVDQVANRPMLNGLNDVINIVTQSRKTPGGDRTEEFSRAGMNWLKNFGASWSPSLWRQTRQAMSQERLNTKLTPDETGGKEKYKTLGKRVIEQMGMHDIPEWMGWKAPAGKQYDIMGNVKSPVIADSSPMTDFFFRLVHPMRPSEDEPHPAFKMIANYNNNLPEGEEPYIAQDFQASYSDGGKRIAFSEKQAEQFYKLAGGANDIIFGKMNYDPNATGPAMVAQMRDFKEQVSEAGTIARRELERYVKGDITELPSPEVIAEEVVKARRKSLLNKSSEKRVKFSAKKTDRETLEERAKQAADKDVARESLKRLGLRKS